MRLRRLVREILRVPLAWKIAGANALLLVVLALSFYALPAVLTGPRTSSAVVIGGMLAAAMVNIALVSLALRPIHELERTAEALWSGATEVRVRPSRLADREVTRVARTINGLLENLAADRARLHKLTGQLLESRASERAAIARELTESVAQTATALALECAALKASNSNGNSSERLERIGRATTSLVEEIRRLARDVHPRHIDELGLDAALQSLLREAASDSVEVTYASRSEPATADALPHRVASALYDVAREALQNARSHSGAARIDIALGVEWHAARLSVADDGCGFDTAALDPMHGMGLILARERIALVGGCLEIVSRPGKGTRIVAIVPFAAQRAVEQLTLAERVH